MDKNATKYEEMIRLKLASQKIYENASCKVVREFLGSFNKENKPNNTKP